MPCTVAFLFHHHHHRSHERGFRKSFSLEPCHGHRMKPSRHVDKNSSAKSTEYSVPCYLAGTPYYPTASLSGPVGCARRVSSPTHEWRAEEISGGGGGEEGPLFTDLGSNNRRLTIPEIGRREKEE